MKEMNKRNMLDIPLILCYNLKCQTNRIIGNKV